MESILNTATKAYDVIMREIELDRRGKRRRLVYITTDYRKFICLRSAYAHQLTLLT